MNIYTKTGDKGETSLLGGKRVAKDCLEIEAIGEVDELNAVIGLLIAMLDECSGKEREILTVVQHKLFNIGGLIADVQADLGQVPGIGPEDVSRLERYIDETEETLAPLRQFILPGGTEAAALAFSVRAICRRAERQATSVSRKYESLSPLVPQYLNRLSDLLFVMGRSINAQSGEYDVIWDKHA